PRFSLTGEVEFSSPKPRASVAACQHARLQTDGSGAPRPRLARVLGEDRGVGVARAAGRDGRRAGSDHVRPVVRGLLLAEAGLTGCEFARDDATGLAEPAPWRALSAAAGEQEAAFPVACRARCAFALACLALRRSGRTRADVHALAV